MEAGGPIRFEARLSRPKAPARATWSFLRLLAAASGALPSRGLVAVDGRLAGVAFASTLQPDGEGGHWLEIPGALSDAAGVRAGDRVVVDLVVSQRVAEPDVPGDLREALSRSPAAAERWSALTPAARRDWIQWLDTAKKVETRQRRIASTADMLLAGKRRVCCFDRSGRYGGGMSAPEAAP
jgi:hypothetical protein